MRCKKHPADASGGVGVCASCLRERLFALIAAQARQASAHARASAADDFLAKTDPPPPVFPRSVSPYVSRRKSDASDAWPSPCSLYTTPLVGPGTATTTSGFSRGISFKKKKGSFSLLSNLFRSRTDKFDSDPKEEEASSSSSPYSWLPSIFSSRRRKQSTICYIEDVIARDQRRLRTMDRGMSPAMESESEGECEPSTSTEATPGKWKRKPAEVRRRRDAGLVRNMSGLAIFLSPLVRPSPNRQLGHKGGVGGGIQPDITSYSGEMRAPSRHHLSAASSLCSNRSRKMVDICGSNRNRRLW